MDLSKAFDSLNHQLFADDNNLYACDMSLNVLVEKLETSAKSVFFSLCIFSQVRNITERIILISTTGLR